jgi:hypothetical protein
LRLPVTSTVPVSAAVAISPAATLSTRLLLLLLLLRRRRRLRFGAGFFAGGHALIVFARLLQKIGDIEEGVSLEPEFDEGGLHPRQNACDASFVNAAYERILVGALEVNFDKLVVFKKRDLGLVAIRRNHQLFCHLESPLPKRRGDEE